MQNTLVIVILMCLQLSLNTALAEITSDQTKVQAIFDRLVKAAGKDSSEYSVIVEKSDQLNAYATLGKKIVVFTGLIDSLKNETALAFVIAHELGHIEERHVVNSIFRQGAFSFVKHLFFKESKIYDGVSYFHNLHYSRGSEKEADHFAIELMNKLYCKSPGKLEFFEKLAANQKAGKLDEYFSTHPLPSSRLEYLHDEIREANCVL